MNNKMENSIICKKSQRDYRSIETKIPPTHPSCRRYESRSVILLFCYSAIHNSDSILRIEMFGGGLFLSNERFIPNGMAKTKFRIIFINLIPSFSPSGGGQGEEKYGGGWGEASIRLIRSIYYLHICYSGCLVNKSGQKSGLNPTCPFASFVVKFFYSIMQFNFTSRADFFDTRCEMYNIQNFNMLGGYTINNNVCVQNNVAVHSAFGWNMATYGVSQIPVGERFNSICYLLVVPFSLKIAEHFNRIVVDTIVTCFKLGAYFKRLARNSFFHCLCSLLHSSHDINSPSSMRRICSKNSSCVQLKGTLGFHLSETEEETEYIAAGSQTFKDVSSCILYNLFGMIKSFLSSRKINNLFLIIFF